MEITLNPGIIISQLINFAILYWIFSKWVSKPLIQSINERRELTAKLEKADTQYESMIADAQSQADGLIKEGTQKKQSIIAEAQSLAKSEGERIVSQAQIQGSKIVDQAQEKATMLEKDIADNFEQ